MEFRLQRKLGTSMLKEQCDTKVQRPLKFFITKINEKEAMKNLS